MEVPTNMVEVVELVDKSEASEGKVDTHFLIYLNTNLQGYQVVSVHLVAQKIQH